MDVIDLKYVCSNTERTPIAKRQSGKRSRFLAIGFRVKDIYGSLIKIYI